MRVGHLIARSAHAPRIWNGSRGSYGVTQGLEHQNTAVVPIRSSDGTSRNTKWIWTKSECIAAETELHSHFKVL